MPSLAFTLSGVLQAWGTTEQGDRRPTSPVPSKSGVMGLLAAAQGRSRTDSLDDLMELDFAVRVDAKGSYLSDYHTVLPRSGTGLNNTFITRREYLQDAVFVAAVSGDDRELLLRLKDALRVPVYSLYLGRRGCSAEPPNPRLSESTLLDSLGEYPFQGGTLTKYGVRLRDGRYVSNKEVRALDVHVTSSDGSGYLTNDISLSRDGWSRTFAPRRVAFTAVNNPLLKSVEATDEVMGL